MSTEKHIEHCSRFYSKYRLILVSMSLIFIVFVLYYQVGNHDFLNYDDNDYVTNNPNIAAGMTGKSIAWAFFSHYAGNWHPITWLSHMLDVQLYGLNPRGHHLTNVAIHAAATVLLLLLLFRLTGRLWRSSFVAALFALHPLHVESVAWIAERKDVLSAVFGFASLLLYAEYVARQKLLLYFFAFLLFLLGLMSKQMLVTLPIVMLLIDFWPLGRHEESCTWMRRRGVFLVFEKLPFFAAALISGIIAVFAQQRGGAVGDLGALPMDIRVSNAITAYVKYLGKALWPKNLAVLYPYQPSIPIWQVVGSLLLLLLVTVIAFKLRRRYPYLLMGWFWFLITLSPVIGIIQVGGQAMADRYTYIPSIGLFIIAVWLVSDIASTSRWGAVILVSVSGIIITICSILTWTQLGHWRDSISLYQHTLNVTTGNSAIHYNLGISYAEKGELDAAVREYNKALQARPGYVEAHYNLGLLLAMKGDFDGAIQKFQTALLMDPQCAEAHYNIGIALLRKGETGRAIREFQEELKVNPGNMKARSNLRSLLSEMNRK